MNRMIVLAALAAGLAAAVPASASDAGYIYGRVVTDDGQTFQGALRWGDEEAFWEDMFNATKAENEYVGYVDEDVLRQLRRERRDFWENLFQVRNHEFGHIFAVRFGDLKRIDVRGGSRLTVEFRNGERLDLNGGSNDVGARITVVDPNAGTQRIRWRNIRSIEFAETPQQIEKKLGLPLYGTVKTRRYEYTGFIQWDNDECLTTDELDGDVRDGDVSIPFGDIASIRKYRRGALVTLVDGSQEYLTGSNDVNGENRGVVVKVHSIGSVKVGWDDFEEVTFQHPAEGSGRSYAEFGNAAPLTGVIETRGGKLAGRIVFDLDEAWDFELLQGKIGDTEFQIPFREIVRIVPRGTRRSMVYLRSGAEVELEDAQDVSRDNDGMLVFDGGHRPTYVAWRDVKEIQFGKR